MTATEPERRPGSPARLVRFSSAKQPGPRAAVALVLLLSAIAPARSADDGDLTPIVIKAGRIHTVSGDPIDGGVIIVRDKVIEAVGRDLEIPEQARVLELTDGVVTPGLIDACCVVNSEIPQAASSWVNRAPQWSFWLALSRMKRDDVDGPGCGDDPEFPPGPADAVEGLAPGQPTFATWAEHSSEVTPHRLVIDSLNLASNDFARLMKGGVTTVYVSPDSASVIGSRGAIVKTGGPADGRIVRRTAAVKATTGSDPSRRGRPNYLPPRYGPTPSFHTRRPTTRMGVEWVFRKAFHDAQRARQGLEIYGADMPPEPAIPVLQQVLDGDIPLRIQARMQHDIFTALRLAAEFRLKFVLEEATEAYRCLPQLSSADVPVIFGPLFMTPTGYRRQTGEADRPRLNTPKQLADAGIKFALTAQELRDEEGLVRQGMCALRHGLSAEQALRATTATPAELLGLSGQIGVVAAGAAADLVVWSGEPFAATSRPLLVMIDGQVVHEQ